MYLFTRRARSTEYIGYRIQLSLVIWGEGLLHVDMFAHNKSGIAY
jgi:hypothetical protein